MRLMIFYIIQTLPIKISGVGGGAPPLSYEQDNLALCFTDRLLFFE